MDIRPRTFASLDDLRVYSYRVASVVGGWLTELFGVSHPWVLDRAYALGHAMQLTNILRDVGEDARNGRVYLPTDRLAAHSVDPEYLRGLAATGARPALPSGYEELLDELMSVAEEDYARAFQAIPYLPAFLQGPVAIAAQVYRGIHREIRRNEYDNVSRRARTSLLRKAILGTLALLKLKRAKMQSGDPPLHAERLLLPEAHEKEEMVA
jgi:phytoene synthase